MTMPSENDGKTVYFRSHRDELSNFYPCQLKVFGRIFHSAEAAYQFRKAIHHSKWEIAEDITACRKANDAKSLGNQINRDNIGQSWLDKRTDVMLDILETKAKQCNSFRQRLIRTGNKELIENTNDEFWARGRYDNGENQLGVLLMLLRQKLSSETVNVDPPENKSPQNKSPQKTTFHVTFGDKKNYRKNEVYIQTHERYEKQMSTNKRCMNCKEFNHSTQECGFRKPAQCRQCFSYGHKQKFCSEFRQ